MPLGITDMVGLAASLVFAIPAAMLGLEFVADGRLALGATLLVFAVLMVVLPRRVPTPSDVPGILAGKAADKVTESEDEES